jgi:hypothetical protein
MKLIHRDIFLWDEKCQEWSFHVLNGSKVSSFFMEKHRAVVQGVTSNIIRKTVRVLNDITYILEE